MTFKELYKNVLKATMLGSFDQSVNHIMHIIRDMDKLEEEELAIIRYNLNKLFRPKFKDK